MKWGNKFLHQCLYNKWKHTDSNISQPATEKLVLFFRETISALHKCKLPSDF